MTTAREYTAQRETQSSRRAPESPERPEPREALIYIYSSVEADTGSVGASPCGIKYMTRRSTRLLSFAEYKAKNIER